MGDYGTELESDVGGYEDVSADLGGMLGFEFYTPPSSNVMLAFPVTPAGTHTRSKDFPAVRTSSWAGVCIASK